MNFIFLLLLSAAFVVIQLLIGGTRMLFSFPSYALIGSAAVLSAVSIRRAISPPSLFAVLTTVVLAGYVMVRAWISPLPYLAWPDLSMAAACLCVYLFTALYLTESRHRLWIVGVLLAIAAVEIGVGVIQFGGNKEFMLFGFIRPDNLERAAGLFISANHFAGYLEMVAMLAIAIACWGRWPLPAKILAGYLAAMCYVGVVISGSRGGYISSAFSLVAFCCLSLWIVHLINPKKTPVAMVLGVLAVVAVLGVCGTLMVKSRLVRERLSKDATRDVRTYNWLAALDQFHQAPWFGTGSGTHLIYGRLYRRPQIQADPVHAHGDYLEMLAEYGVVGEAFAVAFLLAHLASGFAGARGITIRRLRNPVAPPRSDALALCLGSLGAIAALMAHSVVDFNMHIPGNALVVSFLFGILANPGVERSDEAPKRISAIVLLRFALIPLGVCLVAGVAPRIKGEYLSEKARKALRKEKYSKCVAFAKEAILAQPLNYSNYFYLGEANRALALGVAMPAIRPLYFRQALDAYREGLKRFPQDENLLVRSAQALDGLREYDQADQAYQAAIKTDPNLGLLYGYYAAHFHLLEAEGARNAAAEEKRIRAKAAELTHDDVSRAGMNEADFLARPQRRW